MKYLSKLETYMNQLKDILRWECKCGTVENFASLRTLRQKVWQRNRLDCLAETFISNLFKAKNFLQTFFIKYLLKFYAKPNCTMNCESSCFRVFPFTVMRERVIVGIMSQPGVGWKNASRSRSIICVLLIWFWIYLENLY